MDCARGFACSQPTRFCAHSPPVSGATTLANAAFLAAFTLYAVAPGPLGQSSGEFGWTLGAIGVGAAAGSLSAARVERWIGRSHALWLSRVGWGVVFVAPLLARGWWLPPVVCAGSVLGAMWAVLAMSVRQHSVPAALRGQVAGAFRGLTYGCAPLGSAVGGALVAWFSPPVVFAIAAAGMVLLIIPLRIRMSTRALDTAHRLQGV